MAMLFETGAIELADGDHAGALTRELDAILAQPGSEAKRVRDLVALLMVHDAVAEVYIDDDQLSLLLEQW